MKLKWTLFVILILGLIAGGAFLIFKRQQTLAFRSPPEPLIRPITPPLTIRHPQIGPNYKCPGEKITHEAEDNKMEPALQKGQKFEVITNYYSCNPPKRNELVWFGIPTSKNPVVRRIVAIEGDRFELLKSEAQNNWNILINKKLYVINGKTHSFGKLPTSPLMLYQLAHKGRVPKDFVLIFSDTADGSRDSSEFGVIQTGTLLGKVRPLTKNKTEP